MNPIAFKLEDTLAPMSHQHWLGCDAFGRDLVQVATRASFESFRFAVIATLLSLSLGLFLGSMMAIAKPSVRASGLFVLDLISALPFILIALALASVLGPGYTSLLASLALATLPGVVRLSYLRSLELRSEHYFGASVAFGATRIHLFRTHLIPGLLSVITAKAPGLFAQALLAEAALSFIGVGAPIGADSLGSLIASGKSYLIEAPQILIAGAVPLALSVMILQVLSEHIFDSKLSNRAR